MIIDHVDKLELADDTVRLSPGIGQEEHLRSKAECEVEGSLYRPLSSTF